MHQDGRDDKAGIACRIKRAISSIASSRPGEGEQCLFACSLARTAHTVKVVGIGMVGLRLTGGECDQSMPQQPLLPKPGQQLPECLVGLQERLLVGVACSIRAGIAVISSEGRQFAVERKAVRLRPVGYAGALPRLPFEQASFVARRRYPVAAGRGCAWWRR